MAYRWTQGETKQGRKTVTVYTAKKQRFYLYQSEKQQAVMHMWVLWDSKKDTQWFLYGADLKEGRTNAESRIEKILASES